MTRMPGGRGLHEDRGGRRTPERGTPEHGIPTVYRGVRYRSRLEARWAALFDLLEWRYQYEPFDLSGWIPDFLLMGKIPVLVEVKPHLELRQETKDKVLGSGAEHDILVTGMVDPLAAEIPRGVLAGKGLDSLSSFGWLHERTDFAGEPLCGGVGMWSRSYFGLVPSSSEYGMTYTFGYSTLTANWLDRISGCSIDPTFSFCGDYKGPLPHDLWNWAGNEVQWRKGEDRSV